MQDSEDLAMGVAPLLRGIVTTSLLINTSGAVCHLVVKKLM